MLPYEIEPFATHHIAKLDKHINEIDQTIKTLPKGDAKSYLEEIQKDMIGAANALTRFKVCMADEVKQKHRYADYAREHGYPYS